MTKFERNLFDKWQVKQENIFMSSMNHYKKKRLK